MTTDLLAQAGPSNTSDSPEQAPEPAASFEAMGLNDAVLANLKDAGFKQPTPIQALFIPQALTGCDVLGQAQTGTGKTAAFLLPIFQRIKAKDDRPAVLILAPTRELALQIHGEVERLGKNLGLSSVTLYGGSSYDPQIEALRRGVDLVVGTPGRVMDHMRARRLDLSGIQVAVLDEADRMLDLGFRKDIEYILRHCPKERQTLLLSATIPDDIQRLVQRFMHEPKEVWTAPEKLTVEAVEQFYMVAEREKKWPMLLKLLDVERPGLAIIFCTTKASAKRLAAKLKTVHLNAKEIHGDLVQTRREKIMTRFRTGKVQLLVATDVASRGIDVDNITHIVNYDIPYKLEDYVHRIGRTGRMNRCGKAFTFVTPEEAHFLTGIEQLINREIQAIKYDALESCFWPHPPAEPPPEFRTEEAGERDEPEVYLEPKEGGRGKGRSRRGERRGRGGERSRDQAPRSESPGARESAADGAADGAGDGAGEGGKRRRRRGRRNGKSVEAVCSACGASTTLPFEPSTDRPVYCDPCFESVKQNRTGGRGAKSQPASEPAGQTSEENG